MAIVYQHRRKDNNKVFYVGIGKHEKRAFDKYRRSKLWKDFVKNHDYTVEITHRDIIWEEACSIEKYLISFYGRRDLGLGTLVNITDGGDAGILNHSKEAIQKMKLAKLGKRLSKEHKNKISESGKGRVVSNATKILLSVKKLGDQNPMYKKAPWNKGKSQTEDVKNKIRLTNLGKKQSIETIQKRMNTIKNKKNHE
jgi:hypothetical protein